MSDKVELLGYLASVLVAVSLMMRLVTRLRIVNLMGALCFSVYGFLIGSMPVAGMNAFIAAINVYHLTRLLRAESTFAVIEVRPDAASLRAFLDFHAADLTKCFSPQRWRTIPDDCCAFMLSARCRTDRRRRRLRQPTSGRCGSTSTTSSPTIAT